MKVTGKAGKGNEMGKKLYVGNMNYRSSEESLRDLFSTYGEVSSVNIIFDRATGQAKGFGFVEMVTEEGAANAIASLNGYEFDGRQLRVNEAINKPAPRRDYRD